MDNRKLIFENGREFAGRSFGAPCEAVCEVVFNTSMGTRRFYPTPAIARRW